MKSQKIHDVSKIEIKENQLSLIIDGELFSFEVSSISPILSKAKLHQLKNIEVSPSGYGLYWPELDEDISIDGLIGKRNLIESSPSHHQAVV
jgi:hypothetical protein